MILCRILSSICVLDLYFNCWLDSLWITISWNIHYLSELHHFPVVKTHKNIFEWDGSKFQWKYERYMKSRFSINKNFFLEILQNILKSDKFNVTKTFFKVSLVYGL